MPETKRKSGDSSVVTGGFIDGGEGPAFSFSAPGSSPLPVMISVPHAGREYPATVIDRMRQFETTSVRLEDRHVDVLAAAVARLTGAPLIVAHAPRAMLDLNRAREDMDWAMVAGETPDIPRHSQANRRARSGLGLVPRRLSGFGEIWKGRLTAEELETRIEGIHRPYHAMVAQKMEAIRDEWGAALLIDMHSMPPLAARPDMVRPPLMVVGDRFGASSDPSLAMAAMRYLEIQRVPAAHNRPYSGGYVLERHSAPTRGLHALQIEICRSTYLDSDMLQTGPEIGAMAQMIAGLVRELGAATARLVHTSLATQAAE